MRFSRSAVLALVCCASLADALVVASASAMRGAATVARTAPVSMQFGRKKLTVEEQLEAKGYWPGEWVCADCGYIFEPSVSPPFEELRPKWKCPQCAGPRRRFVKKAGGQYGTVDDSPVIIGTALTLVATAALVYLGLTI
jgi:rubredoxin